MKVGWDARVLVNGELRGMGTYAFHVLAGLRDCRPELDILLFHDEGTHGLPLAGFGSRRIGPSHGYRWQLWERLGLPLQAYRHGCAILHSPANTTPPRCPIPRVVTLHDAMPFLAWNVASNELGYFHDTQRRAIGRADAIITVSNYSKQDICEALRVPASRVSVIPEAPNPDLRRPEPSEVTAELSGLAIRSPFVLGLAATAERKNTRGVLRAFAELQRAHRDVSLVLTGVGLALQATIVKEMGKLQLTEDHVRLLGFVGQQQLAALYAGCDAFLFLSLYEGFGLPILDAMQCGAPVICSTRTSCPEVAGDAAVMVDPANAEEVAAATLQVLGRDAVTRESWRIRGEARAKAFSWRQTAELTARVYDAVA